MKGRTGLIFLYACFVVFCTSCKTISGDYYESFGEGWGGADYQFRKDGSFTYESHYDVGGEYGNGTYTIRFGRLKLRFESANSETYTSAVFCYARRDSAELNNTFTLLLRDENKIPIPFAAVSYSVVGDTSIRNVTTDFDGKLQIPFDEEVDTLKFHIRSPGYDDFRKQIEVDAYDSLTVYLLPNPRSGHVAIEAGSVRKYSFRQINRKEIRLIDRRIDMVETGDGYTYKRVRHRNIKKLVKKKR